MLFLDDTYSFQRYCWITDAEYPCLQLNGYARRLFRMFDIQAILILALSGGFRPAFSGRGFSFFAPRHIPVQNAGGGAVLLMRRCVYSYILGAGKRGAPLIGGLRRNIIPCFSVSNAFNTGLSMCHLLAADAAFSPPLLLQNLLVANMYFWTRWRRLLLGQKRLLQVRQWSFGDAGLFHM